MCHNMSSFRYKNKLISKQQYEAQLQQIFRMMLDNKTHEEIAQELNINVRTVLRYYQRIEKRYGEMQRQKTDNTLFLECQIFKNRMLNLYKGLENVVVSADRNISASEKAKCAEVAASIAIDVLKMESEGIKAVKELVAVAATIANKKELNNLRSSNNKEESNNNNNNDIKDNQELFTL